MQIVLSARACLGVSSNPRAADESLVTSWKKGGEPWLLSTVGIPVSTATVGGQVNTV